MKLGHLGNMKRAGVVAMLFLALAACSVLPSQPPRFDPYRGLTPNGAPPAQAAQRPPISAAGKSVALVLSSSTEEQFKYVEQALATLKNAPLHTWRDDFEQKGRPGYFVGQIVAKFKTSFARVELVDDFRAATAGRFDYIALIDLGIRKPTSFGTEFAYDINIDILTPRVERIVSLEGHGLDRNTCPGVECGMATDMRALEQAVRQFSAQYDANIR
jgi:hypothetical protein